MAAKDKPNVILVILDSARKDMFGCYGSDLGLTPNMDALAETGTLLLDHYAAACGSAPAHVSIFTGHHPARHQMFHNLCEMRSDLVSLSLLLRRLGYKCFGHLRASFIPPAGYEELFAFHEMHYPGRLGAGGRKSLRGILQDNLRAFPKLYQLLKESYGAIVGKAGEVRAAAALVDGIDSVRYLLNRIEANREEPVFAYTTLLHPHTPYYPPKPFLDRVFINGARPHPVSYEIQRNVNAFANGDFGDADEAMDSVRKCYQADLLYGDHLVGELVRGLEQLGLFEKSILIVTSDHGELLGEHGLINHGATVWEELFATPCILHCPARIGAGGKVSRLTSALDIVPTIFDLLGEGGWLAEQTPLDGESALSAGAERAERCLIVDSPPAVLPERLKAYPNHLFRMSIIRRAARTSSYKYIWQSDGGHQLYRRGEAETPGNSLYASRPEAVSALHARMVRFYESFDPNFAIDRYPIALSKKVGEKMTDPAIRRELQRLGYL